MQAPLEKCQGQTDHCKPLFGRFVGLHPQVGQPQGLFDSDMVHRNGPTLLRERQALLCRQRQGGAPKILRVFIPRVPWTDEPTARKRQLGELPLAGPHQIGPGPLVWSGPLHALTPLRPKRLGPLRALLVSQFPVGLDRPNPVPALPAAACQEGMRSIPTLAEDIDLEPGR